MNKYNKMNYALNGLEMMKLNPDAKLITYDQLNKINNIDEMFKTTNKLIILYLLHSPNSGHWVCLVKNPNNTYTFFDSYGKDIDEQLDRLTPYQRKLYNEQQDRLRQLLKDKNVIYNNVLMQGRNTKVCGMYVTHFLHNSFLTIKDYVDHLIDSGVVHPDAFVADYVLSLINK